MKARVLIFFLFSSVIMTLASYSVPNHSSLYLKQRADSVEIKDSVVEALVDSVPSRIVTKIDSTKGFVIYPDTTQRDTVQADTLQSKSALEEPVTYSSSDSLIFDMKRNRALLYGDSKVNYQNLELTADQITMSLDSSLVHAIGTTDSTGAVKGKPVFKQGYDQYEPDQISYNFKSRKAFIHNVYTQQGEGFLISEESKRDSTGIMYLQGGKYTTCDAHDPHFYMKMTRAKVRQGKNAVFGPAYLVIEGVPTPIAIPYGFFPFNKKYSSGFIMPTYGDETNRGFYLRDGGYYFAINDYIDLKLLGEIYTKGSWGLSAQSTYRVRYKFSGNVNLSYQSTVEGDKNMPDYSKSTSFKITWSHRSDPKSNPTQSFSASVNFATSNYERNNLTSMYNPESYTQSTRTSSVAYSKTFNSIGLTLSSTFNISQNVRDSSISVTLPSVNLSLSRFYPFKRKRQVGNERWYEKIAMSYTGTLSNSISTKENLLFKSSLVKDWRNGMRHQIPISASFALFKYINITPSFNFTDRMYTNKIMQSWENGAVRKDTINGFYNVYNFNMSLAATTKMYGFYRPLKWFGGKKIQAIRHVFTPTVSFNYAPDFSSESWGFYETYVKTDPDGTVSTVKYSPYSNGIYGTAPSGMTGNVAVDISNNVEMKVYSKKDSTGYRKISLIDELGLNMSYNMAAKVRPLSDLNMRIRLKLTKNYTFSMNAVFATYAYQVDDKGNVTLSDKTEYSQGRFGRFQGMSQNLSYTFNNQSWTKIKEFFTGKKKDDTSKNQDLGSDDEEDETDPENQNLDPDRKRGKNGAKEKNKTGINEDGYLEFSIPWSLTVSYGITMRENTSGTFNTETMRYPYKFTQTLNFSGNIRISEGWNINFSSGYDFNYHKLSMTTASLSRDLHCFTMGCSMVIMPYRSYNFTFACKASTLADALKWRKQSSYSGNIDWY